MEEKKSRDKNGRLLPGHAGLKKKGSVSVISAELKEGLAVFLATKASELPGLWDKLKPGEQARLFVDLAAFIIPKQKDLSITSHEPTREAIAELFDFTDDQDKQMWVAQTKRKVFPK